MMEKLYFRYPGLHVCRDEISKATSILIESFRNGGKLLLCGNGGSAADCEHIVGELMKGFLQNRPLDATARNRLISLCGEESGSRMATQLQGALPAISLPHQSALLSAFANDVAADLVYAQMVYGYGRAGDVLWCISTSGNSKNVVNAAYVARANGLPTIALTGEKASALSEICDVTIRVPEQETYKVQELHLPVYHAICASVEQAMFPTGDGYTGW